MSVFAIIGAILAVGFIIVVHEAGHYIVARWCKMRVDRFSIGFGPPIFKRKHGETDFTIGPIPFGGFVQIHGMLVSEEADADDARSYPNRPVWQRFLTIFAGPATNYLAAFVLAIVFFKIEGVPADTSRYVVGGVASSFDAAGKLEPGDVIVSVNGEKLMARIKGASAKKGQRFVDRVQASRNKPIELVVLRGGKEVEVAVMAAPNPAFEKVRDKPAEQQVDIPEFRIGIMLTQETAEIGVISAVGQAAVYPFAQTKKMVTDLYGIATKKSKREQAQLLGPVGITEIIKKEIDKGLIEVLWLLMLLNVYIGLFNLFPLPALDGGRLVFLVYEMVTRRRANPKVEATVHMVGIMALGLLLIVVTFNDCKRVFF